MKINCIVIDDELPAIEQMKDYIAKVSFLNLIGTFNNAIAPLEFIKSEKVDLIFLDIEMEDFNGLQFIKVLSNKPKIILTTAYDSYAVEAFNLNVSDYLLKPISFERFLQSIDKVYELFREKINNLKYKNVYKRDYFFVKTEYRMQRVDFKDILFIEGMKEYLCIHTKNKRIVTLSTFANLEREFPENDFIRVHKSFIVAVSKIDKVEHNQVFIGDHVIPVSATYKAGFIMYIDIFNSCKK